MLLLFVRVGKIVMEVYGIKYGGIKRCRRQTCMTLLSLGTAGTPWQAPDL